MANGTAATSVTDVFFSPRTYLEEWQNRQIAKLIRRDLLPKEQLEGYVYVAKQNDTRFCKVGYAKEDTAQRLKALGKSSIVSTRAREFGRDVGAYRAEQLIHKLLLHCRHCRINCPCRCKNREWYRIEYQKATDQVVAVLFWLRGKPYKAVAGKLKLKPVWEEALQRWEASQNTLRPLDWNDFFYNGPKMDRFGDGCLPPPFPQSLRSEKTGISLNGVTINITGLSNIKSLLSAGFSRRAKGRLTHLRSPASRSPRPKIVTLPNKRSVSLHSGDLGTSYERPDLTTSEPPQSLRQITYDRFVDARDKQPSDIAVPELQANAPGTAFIDNICDSPCDMQGVLDSVWPTGTADQRQELSPSYLARDHDKSRPGHAEGHRGGANYHLRATLNSPDERDPSEADKNLTSVCRGDRSFSRGDESIEELAVRLACMPGAFPEENIEESIKETAHTKNEMTELPRRVCLCQKGMWLGDTPLQRDSVEEDLCGTDSSVIHGLNSVAEVLEVPPVVSELPPKPASSSRNDLSDIPVAVSAPTGKTAHLRETKCSASGGAVEAAKVANISATHPVQDISNTPPPAYSKPVTDEHFDQGGKCKTPSTTGIDSKTATPSAPRISPRVTSVIYQGRKMIIRFPPVDPSWEPPHLQRPAYPSICHRDGQERLKKPKEELKAMDPGSIEDEQRPTRNDPSDEPSEDVSADRNRTDEIDLDAAIKKSLQEGIDPVDREGYHAGRAIAECIARRKILKPKSRLAGHANDKRPTYNGSPSSEVHAEEPEPMRAITDRPFYRASEYIDRTTFRLKELEPGTGQFLFRSAYPGKDVP